MAAESNRFTAGYPFELHYVKALLLEKRYRRCITACRALIASTNQDSYVRPLEQTFVRFYLAAAHDELARAIHSCSRTKIPTISQAEDLYGNALHSLPTPEQCLEGTNSPQNKHQDPFCEGENKSQYPSSTTLGISEEPAPYQLSPPTATVRIPDRICKSPPPIDSARDTPSDFDDLESHESYREIMTPTRVLPKLERDYSSMSLLPTSHQHISQGLMRPIRDGELPKRYYVPPILPYSGDTRSPSRLPKLTTGTKMSSPVRKQLLTASEQASPVDTPVSPVSPLGSASVASEVSVVSPISLSTPVRGNEAGGLFYSDLSEQKLQHLQVGIDALRAQLNTHIRLLQEEKQRTINLQSERLAARLVPGKEFNSGLQPGRPVAPSHSFWSFTPPDVKAVERQRLIEAGRQRGWQRKRFDATRYERLAGAALAEL